MTRQKLKLHAASGVAITCYCLHGQHKYSAQADDALNRVSGSQCSLRTPTSARLQIDGIVQGHDDSGQGRRGRRIWSSLAAPADGSRLASENPGGWLTTSLSWPQRTSRASDPKKIVISRNVPPGPLRGVQDWTPLFGIYDIAIGLYWRYCPDFLI